MKVIAFKAAIVWVIVIGTNGPLHGATLKRAELETLGRHHAAASLDLFREFLSLPNDAHFEEHVEQNLQWTIGQFESRGFRTTTLQTGGPPLLLAERQSHRDGKTVLIYLQIDGQPVDPSQWDQSDPYEPVLKEYRDSEWKEIPWSRIESGAINGDWRIFARSASDAKGPVVMFLAALDALSRKSLKPMFNIKVIMDFEEELGSPHLPLAVDKYRKQLEADMLLVFDGPRHTSNRPTLDFGARGIATISLEVFGPKFPQHSGHYGNYAPNPALRMAQLLASMKDEAGRVTIPGFYDGVSVDVPTRALLALTPDDEPEIRRQLGISEPDQVGPTLQEAIQYPSLNVRGLSAGWVGEQARTIIPSSAIAEIDVRLVPETDASRLIGLIRDHIIEKGYHLIPEREPTQAERTQYGRLASFSSEVNYEAFRTPYDSAVGVWLNSALTRAFGEEPVRIRMGGGSIPISPFVRKLDLPAVSVPTVNKDNNQHSPNENLRVGNYIEGVITFLAILTQDFDTN